MSKSSSVMVRVRCVVEIPVGKWGDSASFDKLTAQAKDEGLRALTKIMQANQGKVIGEPRIVFVTAIEDKT